MYILKRIFYCCRQEKKRATAAEAADRRFTHGLPSDEEILECVSRARSEAIDLAKYLHMDVDIDPRIPCPCATLIPREDLVGEPDTHQADVAEVRRDAGAAAAAESPAGQSGAAEAAGLSTREAKRACWLVSDKSRLSSDRTIRVKGVNEAAPRVAVADLRSATLGGGG